MAEDNVTSIQPWSKTWRDNVSKISEYDQSVVNSKFGGGVVVLRVNQSWTFLKKDVLKLF